HKRADRRLAAQHAVTRVLAVAPTLWEATPQILRAICEGVSWDMGAIWNINPHATLFRSVDACHQPTGRSAGFKHLTLPRTLGPGSGWPGRVWLRREPAWIVDLAEDRHFPRADVATKQGLRGAFAFPILFGKEVTGVVEFLSQKIRPPDEELLSMLGDLGM